MIRYKVEFNIGFFIIVLHFDAKIVQLLRRLFPLDLAYRPTLVRLCLCDS